MKRPRVWKMLFLLGTASLSVMLESAAQGAPDGCLEMRGGVLAHDVDNLWSGTRKEGGIDANIEVIFSRPRFVFVSGLVRANLGVSIHSRGETSKLYAGLLWEYRTRWGLWLDLGLGLAVHTGELTSDDVHRKWLGSRALFRVPLEVGLALGERHRISVLFDHVSNAALAVPNEGMDTLGIRYGHRF